MSRVGVIEKKPNLNLEIELELKDKDGNVISKRREQSDSLVKNFALILQSLMAGNIAGKRSYSLKDTTVTLKKTDGTDYTFPSVTNFQYHAGAANTNGAMFEVAAYAEDDTYGIVVGTGTTSVTRDDYSLEAQVPHGRGDNQLYHGEVTVEEVNGNPPDSVWRIIRTFTNEGSVAIDVNEIGLIAMCAGTPILIARDVLSSPQNVPVFATLTVRYVFTVTV